ncbi:MAG: ThiF family adenylyltransferase [Planctomycetaceae bacterium]|nr:ThiF family adenylyltransferase [Planctomycetaceae bacterium]
MDPIAAAIANQDDEATRHASVPRGLRTVVVVGAGGNIGSHVVPHLARMPEIERLVLIDPDRYEEKNLRSQDIHTRDVGQSKVRVQARRARAIRRDLHVVTHACAVESIPLGGLRCDVIVACLDSRSARQSVNQMAWRLGIPWIDAGVTGGSELLARVNTYSPAFEAPCLECAWSNDDYRLLEVKHACETERKVASTNAPAALGGLAASLAALECARLLTGDISGSLAGRQILLDARHHTHFVTSFRRNPRCRFDHHVWPIAPSPHSAKQLRLRDVSTMCEFTGEDLAISLEGERFAMRARCPCGWAASPDDPRVVGLVRRFAESPLTCPQCGKPVVFGGWDLCERIHLKHLSNVAARRTLASLGFVPRDVFSVTAGGCRRWFEL